MVKDAVELDDPRLAYPTGREGEILACGGGCWKSFRRFQCEQSDLLSSFDKRRHSQNPTTLSLRLEGFHVDLKSTAVLDAVTLSAIKHNIENEC